MNLIRRNRLLVGTKHCPIIKLRAMVKVFLLMVLTSILTLLIADPIKTVLFERLAHATHAATECNSVLNGDVLMRDGKTKIAVIEWQEVEEMK